MLETGPKDVISPFLMTTLMRIRGGVPVPSINVTLENTRAGNSGGPVNNTKLTATIDIKSTTKNIVFMTGKGGPL
jgi:hypothetical protein